MKKIGLFLALVILMGIIPFQTVFADDGAEFEMYYDFENYSAGLGSQIMPDENWGYEKTNGRRHNFGSYYDSAEDNTMMQVGYQGEPLLWFGRNVTEGKLHISFSFKFTGETRRCLAMFYDGRTANDAYSINIENYSKTAYLNSPAGKLRWYQTDPGSSNAFSMIAWDAQTSDKEIEPQKWYRFDIITTDIANSDASANYYLDGQLINETPVYFAQSMGFKCMAFRCEGSDSSDVMLLDNVRVKRFFGEEGISGKIKGSSQVSVENGRLEIGLSENVDPNLLVPENILITNSATGETITGFEVIKAETDGFEIGFTEKLKPGNYKLLLKDTVRGGVLDSKMIIPVEFRTEYQTKKIYMEYLNLNFDDYDYTPDPENPPEPAGGEDNRSLPDGFRNIGCLDETYAQSVRGRSGSDGDNAIGFMNPADASIPSRFIYKFDSEIAALTEYDISFEIKQENMYWYTYLLEPGDDNAENSGYNANIAIASANSAGNLYYAQTRTANKVKKIGALAVPKNEWHTVHLKVKPRMGSTALYEISVDDGEAQTVEVSRSFDKNPTIGIGFGYLPTKDKNGYLLIDNVKIASTMDVLYPEVESVSYINYDGTELKSQSVMTTLMNKIYVDFNTAVDSAAAEKCIGLSGGNDLKYDIDFESREGKTRAVINLSELLEKGESYTLSVSDGITSKYSDEVRSEVSFEKTFSTRRDLSFRMFENNIDETKKIYTAKLVKNNNAEGKYTIAVAGYKNVIKTIDGEQVTVPQMVGMKYAPLEINADTKGIMEIKLDIGFDEQCDSYKAYLWTYPQLHGVTLGEANSIN